MHGLSCLDFTHLQGLLIHPARLLELQERIFLDGGEHWRTVPRTDEHLQQVAVGWALLPVQSSPSELTAISTKENEERTGRSAHPTC